jgi:hypothetical protein
MKVFWSWQADLDPRLHQYLVRDALRDALRDACDHIAQADEVEEADRPQVDHDTAGVVGTPDIVASILTKVEEAAVFVADVTPVGRTVPTENRPGRAPEDLPPVKFLQNPNVMSELGYADRAIGQGRIILVANSARYPGPEALPFDWRHRRGPVLYHLPDGAIGSQRQAVRIELAGRLAEYIRPILTQVASGTPCHPSMLAREASATDPGVWSGADNGVVFNESMIHDERKTAILPPGPRIYVRLAPERWAQPSRQELDERMGRHDVRLAIRGSYGSSGVDADGAFAASGIRTLDDGRYLAGGITQWFADNGEIWGVDTTSFGGDEDAGRYFASQLPFPYLALFFRSALAAIRSYSQDGAIEVELGATGLLAAGFPRSNSNGRTPALSDRVSVRGKASDWTAARRNRLLHRFWNALVDAYGLPVAATMEDFECAAGVTLSPTDED